MSLWLMNIILILFLYAVLLVWYNALGFDYNIIFVRQAILCFSICRMSAIPWKGSMKPMNFLD